MTSRRLRLMVCCCLAMAMGSAQKSAAIPPSTASELQNGITLLQEGKYSEARQKFLVATQRNPSSAESFFYRLLRRICGWSGDSFRPFEGKKIARPTPILYG